MPHALLLHGPTGVGKRRFAEVLSQSLLCPDRNEHGACGACPACLQFQAGSHPDCLVVAPLQADPPPEFGQFPSLPSQQGRKAPKTPVVAIDQVRDLSGLMLRTSHQGGWRICVLPVAEALNPAAANGLLKLLEEPPEKLVFILVADEPGKLLPTIRSRCQMLHFGIPDPDQTTEWLDSLAGTDIAPADLRVALAMTRGAPLRAMVLAQAGCAGQLDELIETLGQLRGGQLAPLAVAAAWERAGAGSVLDYWRFWVAELIRCHLGVAALLETEARYRATIENQANGRGRAWLLGLLERLNRDRNLLNGSINTRLLLDDLAIRWAGSGS
ncbi:MAG: DNA polymerase III subunit delta' [Gammaproteobacteria bacterium]|nr:DNA polymerase III subunit delta' [Gammaproteobacteria bacterium]